LGVKNYQELGFKDTRTGKPTLAWSKTLLVLGKVDGNLQIFDDVISEKDLGMLKKRISELRSHLKQLFNTSQDPFYPTEKAKAYRTRFLIFEQEKAVSDEIADEYEEDIDKRAKYYPKQLRKQHLDEIGKAKKRE
jgi:ribosomal protein S15P/S13E